MKRVIVCAVDFEKAFDSVYYRYLFQILKLFGLGDSFCSWVKLMYKGIRSCVLNDGHSIKSYLISSYCPSLGIPRS